MNNGFFSTYFFDAIGHHYADFKGKSSRKEFWLFVLCYFIIALAVSLLGSLISLLVGAAISLLLGLALFIPILALYVRRMHDIGKSGWWLLISMVPLVGAIWFFVLLCKKGESDGAKSKWNWLDTVIMVIVGLSVIALPVSSMLGHKASSSLFDSIEEGLGDFNMTDEYDNVSETDNENSSEIENSAEEGKAYYLFDNSEWISSCDGKYWFVVGTDNEEDVISEREGYIDHAGDLTILATTDPDNNEGVVPIISASQILSKYPGEGSAEDMYISLTPSSEYPNILYFEFHFNGEDPLYEPYGVVDILTKEFSIHEGPLGEV